MEAPNMPTRSPRLRHDGHLIINPRPRSLVTILHLTYNFIKAPARWCTHTQLCPKAIASNILFVQGCRSHPCFRLGAALTIYCIATLELAYLTAAFSNHAMPCHVMPYSSICIPVLI